MDFFDFFYTQINNKLQAFAKDNNIQLPSNYTKFTVELPKNKNHGDIATNIAMLVSKPLQLKPQDFYNQFLPYLQQITQFSEISFAMPGFINFKVQNTFWHNLLLLSLQNKDINFANNNINVNVEFVSANPTGPLHVGNARGAVVGDVLANLYKFCGYNVTKEYYVNDAGNQINSLTSSVYIKYLDILNIPHNLGNAEYPAQYITDLANVVIKQHGNSLVNNQNWQQILKPLCINYVMDLIKSALHNLGVKQHVFSSEAEIATKQNYNNLIDILSKQNLVYVGTLNPPKGMIVEDFEPREQKLFKATLFGDDIDRALEKSNGDLTYFAGDAVYHKNKVDRGFNKLIVVLGSDHIGYGTRISAFVNAYSQNKVSMNVLYTQMVNLLQNGKPAKMSKRSGNFVLLQDVIDAVGKDIVRFIMITRKSDVSLDFDLDKVTQDNMDNPLFYINYAYARINSVIANFKTDFANVDLNNYSLQILQNLTQPVELEIIKVIAKFNRVIKSTISSNDLYKLYLYLLELSEHLHLYWNKGKEDESLRFISKTNQNLTIARVLLLQVLANRIKTIMQLLDINIKERM